MTEADIIEEWKRYEQYIERQNKLIAEKRAKMGTKVG